MVLSVKGVSSSEPWLQRSNTIEEGNESAFASKEEDAIVVTTKTCNPRTKLKMWLSQVNVAVTHTCGSDNVVALIKCSMQQVVP